MFLPLQHFLLSVNYYVDLLVDFVVLLLVYQCVVLRKRHPVILRVCLAEVLVRYAVVVLA